jgi:hypothetical protein
MGIVSKMKAFLGLIINVGLKPLTDIKDFLHIFCMMRVGNDTTEESIQAIKRIKKVREVIEHIEKQFQKYSVPGKTSQ